MHLYRCGKVQRGPPGAQVLSIVESCVFPNVSSTEGNIKSELCYGMEQGRHDGESK